MNILTLACLFLGFLLGGSGLGLFDVYTVAHVKPFIALALGWVGLILGENLELAILKRISPNLLWLSIGQLAATFALTAWGLNLLLRGPLGWPSGSALLFAVLAASMATATDPMTVARAVSVSGSGGGRNHLMAQMATIADVFTALLFWGVISYAHVTVADPDAGSLAILITAALHLVLGLGLGVGLSLLIPRKREPREVYLLLIAAVFLAVGAGVALSLSPLILCLFASAYVMTACRSRNLIREAIHQLEKPIYVAFLIFCGALFRPESLAGIAWVPVLYILLRLAGKLSGVGLAASAAPGDGKIRLLGLGLLSQAGLTVVLAVNIYLLVDVQIGLALVAVATVGILVNQVLGVLGVRFLIRSGVISRVPGPRETDSGGEET